VNPERVKWYESEMARIDLEHVKNPDMSWQESPKFAQAFGEFQMLMTQLVDELGGGPK
jgi:hypothetical protein